MIKPLSKPALLRVYPRLFTGTRVRLPQYEHQHATRVCLAAPGISAYADGERLGVLPLTVESAPRAVTVFVTRP